MNDSLITYLDLNRIFIRLDIFYQMEEIKTLINYYQAIFQSKDS